MYFLSDLEFLSSVPSPGGVYPGGAYEPEPYFDPSVAEMGVYGTDGAWLVENRGVTPDVRVVNLPHATFRGHDAQLERALEDVLKQM